MTDELHKSSSAESAPFTHTPVMVEEVMRLLAPQPGEVAVDCTVGLGGHTALLSDAVGSDGTVVGFDLDPGGLAHAKARLAELPARFVAINSRFDAVRAQLEQQGLRADCVLADLGFGSHQMDDPERGMSFTSDGPLDMRFDREQGPTAADMLARLNERDLADLIFQFGEEPFSRKIARKLVEARRKEPIRTTAQLARLVEEAYGRRANRSRRHPATRTFMALRIAVNNELEALHGLLDAITSAAELVGRRDEGSNPGWLTPGARVVIISFHSLEDRLVKHAFAELAKRELAQKLTRKPLVATAEECDRNPRARSAKLRAVRLGSK